MKMERMNRIRNERHTTLFCVPDGGSITIDGMKHQVFFRDETHLKLVKPSGGTSHLHIDQFGDIYGKRNVFPVDATGMEYFEYFMDDNMGWVEVPKPLLRELHLMHPESYIRISHRSRQNGDTAYLEDSRDTSLFRAEMERRGRNGVFRISRVEGESPIRSYDSFRCKDAVEE